MCNNSELDKKNNDEKIVVDKFSDTAILIDVSITMQSTDFEPNRMTVVKNAVEKFINDKDEKQSFSIIVFAGNSYLICPLTKSKSELIKSLDNLDKLWKRIRFGTNYSEALLNGVYSLQNSKADFRNIMIFSDGTSNIKNSQLQFSKDAVKNFGIKVNSVIIKPKDFEIIPKGIDKNGLVFEKVPAKPLDSTLIKISHETKGIFEVYHTKKDFKNFDAHKFISKSDSINMTNINLKIDKKIYENKFQKLQKTTDSIKTIIK